MSPPLINYFFNKPFYIGHKLIIALDKWYNSTMTTHAIYNLTNTASVPITPDGAHSGMDITIQNINETANVYVGGEGVTSAEYGYRILPNHAISFELNGMDDLYLTTDELAAEAAVIKIRLEVGQ